MWSALSRSLRSFTRRGAYASFSLALLTLGIGAATAIFTIVHGTLLRPLPYKDSGSLFSLLSDIPTGLHFSGPGPLSVLELVRWRERSHAFSGIAGYSPVTVKLTGSGNPEALPGMVISAGMMETLGISPALGRAFRREEEAAGSGVAMISDGLWQRRFGRDPAIVGRTVNLDDEPRVIVGVMPRGFTFFFQDADVWLPLILTPDRQSGGLRVIAGVARLRDGASLAQGVDELTGVSRELEQVEPAIYRLTKPALTPLRERLLGGQRLTLLVLLGAVLALVTIGAANVAGLAGADAVGRRNTTMIRLALGASRREVVRMRVGEGALLAVVALPAGLAAGAGILAALGSINAKLVVGPADILTPAVLGFATLVAGFMGVATMLPAAFGEASLGVTALAGTATKTAGGRSERAGREGLLAAQVAITVVLLVASALLARNLSALLTRWPGFQADGVLVAPLALSAKAYATPPARALQVERLLAAVREVPGVKAAATIQTRFVLNETMQTAFEIDGRPAATDVQQTANIRHSSPGVFEALGTRILAGRPLEDRDREGAPFVAVVSASFARQFWGGTSPLGSRIRRGNRKDAPWMEVVGVVEDVFDAGAGVDLGPTLYVSYLQQNTPTARVTLVVRAAGSAEALAGAVRKAIWQADPDQTIESVIPLGDLMLRSAAEPRLRALVVSLFGGAALLLVLAGLYAATQYAVVRRTSELGVRAALGAPPAALIRTTIAQSLRPAIAGLVAGGLLSIPAVGLMQRSLRESFTLGDAPLLIWVLAGFLALALLAAGIPARRALRISPTLAMRN